MQVNGRDFSFPPVAKMASSLPKMHVLLLWCSVVSGKHLPNQGPLYIDGGCVFTNGM